MAGRGLYGRAPEILSPRGECTPGALSAAKCGGSRGHGCAEKVGWCVSEINRLAKRRGIASNPVHRPLRRPSRHRPPRSEAWP